VEYGCGELLHSFIDCFINSSESEGFVNSSEKALSIAEICDQIKLRGYARSQVVRIYGEEFEILSDPFPNNEGVAVQVRSRRTAQVRALQLPATLIPSGQDRSLRAA
jgi:hypothetical protein